ncbi:MAG TPA: [Fe-Fe] hydrogenase large subunit C-terminal domain-containing protein [Ignavibacteriales bacterium]|nr:[Fe-Fe] hydrogenase large subunit C-terminal domain-containing protein [Ignavibacteriales bacterium]
MSKTALVSTIGQKCRKCYSCVKGCPAKAIRVLKGQAVVIPERCIGCGHCVKVCSQDAKLVVSDLDKAKEYINEGRAYAIIAPSFPASFDEESGKVISALRKLGFSGIIEAAFGADLISREYAKIIENIDGKVLISSTCPAVVNLIEKFNHKLVPNLVEIVSPMIATGRYLKKEYGSGIKTVFIGPCIAKKSEAADEDCESSIDAVLTFKEIKDLFRETEINVSQLAPTEPDPPLALYGKAFPLSGGLLKSSSIDGDILSDSIITVEGKDKNIQIIEEILSGNIKSKFIDILFCEGCISGPGMHTELSYYGKREKVLRYIEEKVNKMDKLVWKNDISRNHDINIERKFSSKNQRRPTPPDDVIAAILGRTNKSDKRDELNCGACGYDTCREFALAISKELAEEEMCLPYLIDKLEKAYDDLKMTQEQLHSAEKLASIGQLAAGIAHEINNPLGSIMLYSSMLKRDLEKRTEGEYSEDLSIIIDEAKRCKNIVSDLLNFAKQRKLVPGKFDVSELIQETVKIIAINPMFSDVDISINNHLDECIIEGDRDQLKEVFINLLNNACDAMENSESKRIDIDITGDNDNIFIDTKDTGCGIPKENLSKLFTPFFTTKKMGKGTGLGLAISYGIVKMHNGEITAKNDECGGAVFILKIPRVFK